MPKKLTITVDADVYNGLHSIIGRRRISRLLNDLARAHLDGRDLAAGYDALCGGGAPGNPGYAAMAADEAREAEADAWSESLIHDVAREPDRGDA